MARCLLAILEKGEAKKAFVLDVADESEVDDVMISEKVDDKEEVLESDDLDREYGAGFSIDAVIVAHQNHIIIVTNTKCIAQSHTHTCLQPSTKKSFLNNITPSSNYPSH